MARGINKVILIGNLGADPDMRSMPSGDAIANLSLATSESWNDKQSGEKREKTEWHRIVAFGRLAEIIGQYCRKGSKVYIEGKLQTRKWTDNQGIEKYMTEIVASELQMLDSRSSEGSSYDNANYASPSNNQNKAKNNSRRSTMPSEPVAPQQSFGPEDDIDAGFDDDSIPF